MNKEEAKKLIGKKAVFPFENKTGKITDIITHKDGKKIAFLDNNIVCSLEILKNENGEYFL